MRKGHEHGLGWQGNLKLRPVFAIIGRFESSFGRLKIFLRHQDIDIAGYPHVPHIAVQFVRGGNALERQGADPCRSQQVGHGLGPVWLSEDRRAGHDRE